ncbi:hypothetical protein, partial [Rhizobium phaseoli]|uniref:hypothetical protein n=1 Tax=Rhizobium phaseoli TaxID=396 RepID=UPI001AECFDE7
SAPIDEGAYLAASIAKEKVGCSSRSRLEESVYLESLSPIALSLLRNHPEPCQQFFYFSSLHACRKCTTTKIVLICHRFFFCSKPSPKNRQ